MQPGETERHRAAVGAAMLGALVDPVVGSLAAAGFAALAEKVVEDRLRRFAQFMRGIQAESGLSSNDVGEILDGDRLKRGLFERATTVAASSQTQAKITLLAKVFARALTSADDPHIERAHLLIGLVADLEEPHIEVLAVMASDPHHGGRTAWPYAAIVEKRPSMNEVLTPLLKRLVGLGLIRTP